MMNQIVNNQVSTTVVINQPVVLGPKLLVGSRNGTRDWTTGLCGCFEDVGSMAKACCCMEWTILELSSRMGDCFCMPYFLSPPVSLPAMRTRTRTLGDVRGSICNDWLTLYCCLPLAVCQMDRELTAMGL